MAVLIEAINVVVKIESLEARYPGGLSAFREACPNETCCSDGHLVRVGFMSPADVRSFVGGLRQDGLTIFEDGEFRDGVVIDQTQGPTGPCPWVAFEAGSDGPSHAWLVGTEPGPVATPPGWEFEESLSTRGRMVPTEEAKQHLRYSGVEGGQDVYIDRRTGKKQYVQRVDLNAESTTTAEDEISPVSRRLDEISAEALSLEKSEIKARSNKDEKELTKIFQSLQGLFNEAESIDPGDGPAHAHAAYVKGLLCRIQHRWEDGARYMNECVAGAPDQPSAWLELTWCLSELERLEEAEQAALESIRLLPQSGASWGNLVIVYLQQGRTEEARQALDNALGFDPEDSKNQYMDKNFDKLSAELGPPRT